MEDKEKDQNEIKAAEIPNKDKKPVKKKLTRGQRKKALTKKDLLKMDVFKRKKLLRQLYPNKDIPNRLTI